MKLRPLFIILSLLIGLLAACASTATPDAPDEVPATQAPDSEDQGYPVGADPDSTPSGYPVDLTEDFESRITPNAPAPEFSSETGALTVDLVYPDGERPVRGLLFFASGTIPIEGVEDGYIPVFEQNNDPSGYSDAQGKLVISNIPPGRYVLVLFTPLGAVLVESAEDNETTVFNITAGELTDLGELSVFLNADTLEP